MKWPIMPSIACGSPFFRRAASDLFLAFAQLRDAPDGFGCDRRMMGLIQVVELVSEVRHARCFLNRAAFVKLVEA